MSMKTADVWPDSTHHPPQQNILVVGEDEYDVARFGTVRAPDAGGEQRRKQPEERGGPGETCAPPEGRRRSASAPHTHDRESSTATTPGLIGLHGHTTTGVCVRGEAFASCCRGEGLGVGVCVGVRVLKLDTHAQFELHSLRKWSQVYLIIWSVGGERTEYTVYNHRL